MAKAKQYLLIVDDEEGIQKQLRWSFDGYELVFAANRVEAIAQLRRFEPVVVTLDLGLPPDTAGASEGILALEEMLALSPHTKVIVVTGNDDRANALECVNKGAYDFYQKPIDPELLSIMVARAFHVSELEGENRKLAKRHNTMRLPGVIGSSPQMLRVCRDIEKIAQANVATLLLGESGTGKEVIARALHEISDRSNERFVAINCAAIPENLLESELFGYEKGAFTGATRQNIGRIEYANGGTLFLDEIGDLSLSMQVKLLRFLQERTIERVGGRKEIPLDVRVVCATHQNLSELITDSRFREDLYYRISEITINIPPLRDRDADVVLLAKAIMVRSKQELGKKTKPKSFSREALDVISAYPWPGNVRELENVVRRAVLMSEGAQITVEDLGIEANADTRQPLNLKEVRDHAEHEALVKAFGLCEGNVSRISELLGVSRPTLYDLMGKHGIK
ncbi:MAG: PEP-CTERM-box response regulator transcription factor [Gammaproteobacteria bacterium]|nr:PEP-CTERM-box response regulator transcription factor [Gammaproteobacteria bacterium]